MTLPGIRQDAIAPQGAIYSHIERPLDIAMRCIAGRVNDPPLQFDHLTLNLTSTFSMRTY